MWTREGAESVGTNGACQDLDRTMKVGSMERELLAECTAKDRYTLLALTRWLLQSWRG